MFFFCFWRERFLSSFDQFHNIRKLPLTFRNLALSPFGQFAESVFDNKIFLFGIFGQCRGAYWKGIYPVVEILPEITFPYFFFKVFVGGTTSRRA
jgi:hypothetical protein